MTRVEIFEKLKEVFKVAIGSGDYDKYTEDSLLTTDLGLNSVGILYVVIAIEEFFNVQFDDVGFNDFKTIKDVIDYIEGKINQ